MQIADDDFDARVEAIRAHGHEVPVHEFGPLTDGARRRARRTCTTPTGTVELDGRHARLRGEPAGQLTEGRTSAQGRAASIWAASDRSVASSSGAAIS